jgi:23S rRNA (uracil1939-C5)-methyltransferase
LLLLPELSDLINKLKLVLKELLVDKEKCKILITKADNGIDLIIETKKPNSLSLSTEATLKDFAINNKIIRFTIINNGKWSLVYFLEKPYILFGNTAVTIDNHSFLQVSKETDIILAEYIDLIFGKLKITNNKELQIADLFCGRGTLTIPASKFGNVDGFEAEISAVKALTAAVNNSKLKAQIYQRDLFKKPLDWDELNKYDVVIINPPRAGAKEQAKLLATSTVQTIIYLSCNPESFAQDTTIITRNKRYELEEVTPIDQFQWSSHIELLGVFRLAV